MAKYNRRQLLQVAGSGALGSVALSGVVTAREETITVRFWRHEPSWDRNANYSKPMYVQDMRNVEDALEEYYNDYHPSRLSAYVYSYDDPDDISDSWLGSNEVIKEQRLRSIIPNWAQDEYSVNVLVICDGWYGLGHGHGDILDPEGAVGFSNLHQSPVGELGPGYRQNMMMHEAFHPQISSSSPKGDHAHGLVNNGFLSANPSVMATAYVQEWGLVEEDQIPDVDCMANDWVRRRNVRPKPQISTCTSHAIQAHITNGVTAVSDPYTFDHDTSRGSTSAASQ